MVDSLYKTTGKLELFALEGNVTNEMTLYQLTGLGKKKKEEKEKKMF